VNLLNPAWYSDFLAARGTHRRTKLFRYMAGDRSKSYRPRGLRIGRWFLPLPFIGGRV
jgi:hypothetical protein